MLGGTCQRRKKRAAVEADGGLYESSDEVDEREYQENRQGQNERDRQDLLQRINDSIRPRGIDRIRQLVAESQQRRDFVNRLE